MGKISDSINLLTSGKNKDNDMIVLPQGEFTRNVELNFPDGRVIGRLDSYNRKTKVLKLTYTDKSGEEKVLELAVHDMSKEEFEAGKQEKENGFPLYSVSGKLVYLALPNGA